MPSANRPPIPMFAGCVGATFAAVVIGILDFLLFEIRGTHSWATEIVFSKPAFLGLNLLLVQILAFGALGIVCCILFELLSRILVRLSWQSRTIYPVLMTSIVSASLIIMLRLIKSPGGTTSLILLAVVSAIVIYFSYQNERQMVTDSPGRRNKVVFSQTTQLIALFFILSSAFLVPEGYQFYMTRFKGKEANQDRPAIFLIVLDTVRADHLGCYGNTQVSTPHIDRFASEGVLFLNAFSSAPWTVPSHASMFTGLAATHHGADWGHETLRDDLDTIAEKLQGYGYTTAGFSENPFVGTSFGFAQGFQEFHETWKSPMLVRAFDEVAVRTGLHKNRRDYTRRTLSLVRRWTERNRTGAQPPFVFVNLMAAHLPRYPRGDFGALRWTDAELARIEPVNLVPERFYLPEYRLQAGDLSIMTAIYDQQIEYLDRHVGGFLADLRQRRMLDNTIVIITSDHGENLGDHGLIEHQFCVYNSLIHVPLIIWNSESKTHRIVTDNLSTSALFSIISSMASESGSVGDITRAIANDFSNQEQRPLLSEFSNGIFMLKGTIGDSIEGFDYSPFDKSLSTIILGKFKYIWSSDGNRELYDISADFGERENLIMDHPQTALELDRSMSSLRAAGDAALTRPSPVVDQATRDALKALGYE